MEVVAADALNAGLSQPEAGPSDLIPSVDGFHDILDTVPNPFAR